MIARDLKVFSPQSIALDRETLLVPTLAGQLLRIRPQGQTQVVMDLSRTRFGTPFGVVVKEDSIYITTSADESGESVLKIDSQHRLSVLADLSDRVTGLGGLFGLVFLGNNLMISATTDATRSEGRIFRLDPPGNVSTWADLGKAGIPIGIASDGQGVMVALDSGKLMKLSEVGIPTQWIDLQAAGWGIPLGIAFDGKSFGVTTNSGYVLAISSEGKVNPVINLVDLRYGMPSGIAIHQQTAFVATNGGYLLGIKPLEG